jgi:hypothetical protein
VIIVALLGILLLAIAGCACVVWASRGGGPRWVRGVATTTLLAGEVVKRSGKRRRPGSGQE